MGTKRWVNQSNQQHGCKQVGLKPTMNVDLIDPKKQMVCGSIFIVNLVGENYDEEEIAFSRCTMTLTSIRNPTIKMPFPSKLPSKFIRGLHNYVVMWHVKDVVPK